MMRIPATEGSWDEVNPRVGPRNARSRTAIEIAWLRARVMLAFAGASTRGLTKLCRSQIV